MTTEQRLNALSSYTVSSSALHIKFTVLSPKPVEAAAGALLGSFALYGGWLYVSTTDFVELLIVWLSFIALLHAGIWAYFYDGGDDS